MVDGEEERQDEKGDCGPHVGRLVCRLTHEGASEGEGESGSEAELGKLLTLLLLLIALQSQSKGNVQVNGKVKYMQANG